MTSAYFVTSPSLPLLQIPMVRAELWSPQVLQETIRHAILAFLHKTTEKGEDLYDW